MRLKIKIEWSWQHALIRVDMSCLERQWKGAFWYCEATHIELPYMAYLCKPWYFQLLCRAGGEIIIHQYLQCKKSYKSLKQAVFFLFFSLVKYWYSVGKKWTETLSLYECLGRVTHLGRDNGGSSGRVELLWLINDITCIFVCDTRDFLSVSYWWSLGLKLSIVIVRKWSFPPWVYRAACCTGICWHIECILFMLKINI